MITRNMSKNMFQKELYTSMRRFNMQKITSPNEVKEHIYIVKDFYNIKVLTLCVITYEIIPHKELQKVKILKILRANKERKMPDEGDTVCKVIQSDNIADKLMTWTFDPNVLSHNYYADKILYDIVNKKGVTCYTS